MPIQFTSDKYGNIPYLEVIQERGDGIFVPSGWHHQVFNLHDTISINHNFINSCNIEKVWNSLQSNMKDVEKEIEEFKDSSEYANQCQLILKSIFGMDFKIFIKLIMHIADKRMNKVSFTVFDCYKFGHNHVMYDLTILYRIFNLIENHTLFVNSGSISPNVKTQFLEMKEMISKEIKAKL